MTRVAEDAHSVPKSLFTPLPAMQPREFHRTVTYR